MNPVTRAPAVRSVVKESGVQAGVLVLWGQPLVSVGFAVGCNAGCCRLARPPGFQPWKWVLSVSR